MARPNMENIRSLPDFQTVYNWNVSVTKAPAGVTVPPNFNFQCQTATIPESSNTPVEVDIRGHKIRQPGIQQYDGTLDLQMVETVDQALANFIKGWREAQWETGTGVAKTRNESSANFQLQLLDRQDNVKRTFDLIGGILLNAQKGELSGDGSEVMRPTLSVQYDYFKEK